MLIWRQNKFEILADYNQLFFYFDLICYENLKYKLSSSGGCESREEVVEILYHLVPRKSHLVRVLVEVRVER